MKVNPGKRSNFEPLCVSRKKSNRLAEGRIMKLSITFIYGELRRNGLDLGVLYLNKTLENACWKGCATANINATATRQVAFLI